MTEVKREAPKPEYKYTATSGVWMDCGTVVAEGALTSVAQDWNTYVTVVRNADILGIGADLDEVA